MNFPLFEDLIHAQAIINHYTELKQFGDNILTVGNWKTCWFIFAGYALMVAISFAILFHPKKSNE